MPAPVKRTFKTKRVLSNIRTEYRGWGDWEEGDRLIGKLLKRTPNRKNKGRFDCVFEVLEATFSDRKEEKRIIAGKNITLNSMGMFDKAMTDIETGSCVEVIYNGQNKIEGGEWAGQMAHSCEVNEVEEDDGNDSSDEEEEDDNDL